MAPQVEVHEEQTLQAVIIAECEQDYGAPVSQDVPKVLVPLANTPLLDYSLEWLERCGVGEVIVYCRADQHLDHIRGHCRSFMSRRETSTTHGDGLRVTVVASEDCHSLGDAMRDLYAKSLLKGDFILLQGDTVATLDLPSLVMQHRESRALDKSAIMTCVYLGEGARCGGGGGGCGEKSTTATLLVSSTTGKLLQHRRRGCHTSTKLSVPTELLQGVGDVLAYPAAYDPSVTICSEVVPSLFSDNFDYSTLDSLVRGVIEQEELLGYTIKCKVLEGGYAGRAASINALVRVSGEVVRRRAHPLVPEVSLTSHRVRYNHDAFTNTYWDPSAKFPKGSRVTGVVVGAGTEVGATAQLCDSVLGDHCTLGEGVIVKNSVLMGGVCVKARCVLEHCWVGDSAVLGEGVKVTSGCVIGAGVTLGPGITLQPGTRLSSHPPAGDFGPDAVTDPDPAVCGVGGCAYLVKQEEEEEEEEEEEDEEEEDEDGGGGGEMGDEESGDESDEMQMSDEEEHHRNEFRHEVQESLGTALRESAASENIILEINASRHAYNVSMEDVLTTVVQGVLRAGQEGSSSSSGAEGLWQGVKAALAAFQDVLRNYIKKGRDQILVLNAVEALLHASPPFLPLAKGILYELNQTYEVLDDEVVVHWYKGGGAGTAAFPSLKTTLAKFVEWLEEEEEEESEEEDNSP